MDKLSDRLVWLDMEMTGLDPVSCLPIEVAVIITDGQLNEIDGASYEAVIHQPESAFEDMAPIVVDMHTENGLLDRVRQSKMNLEEVDTGLATMVGKHCEAGKALLAGNTIGQDRLFIRRYFPKLESSLHYRQVDVSSFKEMIRRWYGGQALFAKDSSHTAMADIRTSIAELAYYRKNHFRDAE
ncbi:MAG: oligoribonuclease [Myxococcales bacterium]|nr:oligoribonuclease [Myxococcales bacterium]